MRVSTFFVVVFSLVLGGAVSAGLFALGLVNGFLPLDWFVAGEKPQEHAHGTTDFVAVSPQAQLNLGLDVQPITLGPYERTVVVPAHVVDRPGHCEAVVTAPAAGIVTRIDAYPGETVTSGTPLVGLRLIGEELYEGQKDFFKTTRELQIVQDEKQRLEKNPSIAPTRLLELDYQRRRLGAALEAAQQDLVARGLSAEQIKDAGEGKFLTEIVIPTPKMPHAVTVALPAGHGHRFDLDLLKVQLGDKVQTGQTLAVLSNHQVLDVEGHAFRHETGLLRTAAISGWNVQAEFPDEKETPWVSRRRDRSLGEGDQATMPVSLTIRSVSNVLDEESRSFAFRLSLPNDHEEYSRDGKEYRVWRFRPGQRVLLKVPVEKLKDKIVLPAAAIVHEGAEVYVFRQSGNGFQRRPVRVLFEDRADVVIENDQGINVDDMVARNGAAQLNRAMKAQAAGGEGGGHHHHHPHH